MVTIKKVLNECFMPEDVRKKRESMNFGYSYKKKDEVEYIYSFDDAITRISKTQIYGLYTNSEILNYCRKINLPIKEITDFIMP